MLIVIALGGNALLRRGQEMTAENRRANVRHAAQAIAPVAANHQIVIIHGNGPQAGLLASPAGGDKAEPYPFDASGAQTEAMIGYMIEQELRNLLPLERSCATILTMVEVDPHDPALRNPTKFIGGVYTKSEADRLASQKGWAFKADGNKWRRAVAAPEPRRMFELRPIKWLLERNTVVVATGGGGIPTAYHNGKLSGVECVVDKDLASELLARELNADLFVMLTDADAVYSDWGKATQKAIRRSSPAALEQLSFAAGSIGPKVTAACRFAKTAGKHAAIGALPDLEVILAGAAGTTVSNDEPGIVFAGVTSRTVYVA